MSSCFSLRINRQKGNVLILCSRSGVSRRDFVDSQMATLDVDLVVGHVFEWGSQELLYSEYPRPRLQGLMLKYYRNTYRSCYRAQVQFFPVFRASATSAPSPQPWNPPSRTVSHVLFSSSLLWKASDYFNQRGEERIREIKERNFLKSIYILFVIGLYQPSEKLTRPAPCPFFDRVIMVTWSWSSSAGVKSIARLPQCLHYWIIHHFMRS